MKTVSVAFQPGGRTFSYLIEDDSIEVGNDVVIVGRNGGEKVLPVLSVEDGRGRYATATATRYTDDDKDVF